MLQISERHFSEPEMSEYDYLQLMEEHGRHLFSGNQRNGAARQMQKLRAYMTLSEAVDMCLAPECLENHSRAQ